MTYSRIVMLRCSIAALFISVAMSNSIQATEPDATAVRVMTFNIRYGTAKDGENHWDKRKDFLVDVIRKFDPDLLGTQETLAFQRDFLSKNLNDYAAFGAGRDDGLEAGELAALFYKKARFDKVDGGNFWLSPTPDVAGSKGWDASLPRICTWVVLRDKANSNVPEILFCNTHFDHIGKTARLESAKLIRKVLTEKGKNRSIILTGDFNAGVGSEPYGALFEKTETESPIMDIYRLANPEPAKKEGTANSFDPDRVDGARIDWIGSSYDWKIESVEINRTTQAGKVPSDHFPVDAVLKIRVNAGKSR